tara:strand:- start:558 stop:737 length:180 start_codon:yes stop_codon:yes gene_type:complete
MPITQQEATTIKEIVNSYLSTEDATSLFKELVDSVAHHTDNDSVKQSILMLCELYKRDN